MGSMKVKNKIVCHSFYCVLTKPRSFWNIIFFYFVFPCKSTSCCPYSQWIRKVLISKFLGAGFSLSMRIWVVMVENNYEFDSRKFI